MIMTQPVKETIFDSWYPDREEKLRTNATGYRDNITVFRGIQTRVPVCLSTIAWENIVIDRLKNLCSLQKGWDGYKGQPTRFDVAYFAMGLLKIVCPPTTPLPSIVPLSSGGLQIEWHYPHIEIELTIREPNNVRAWVSIGEDDEDGKELPLLRNDFKSIVEYINKLVQPFA